MSGIQTEISIISAIWRWLNFSLIEEMADNRELYRLIGNHFRYTHSPLAGAMLDDWDNYVGQFIKIIPIEYKKVLHDEKVANLQRRIASMQVD